MKSHENANIKSKHYISIFLYRHGKVNESKIETRMKKLRIPAATTKFIMFFSEFGFPTGNIYG